MGRIVERIKEQVSLKFENEKFKTDLSQEIDEDGLGFKIKREDGVTLIYNGTTNEYKTDK